MHGKAILDLIYLRASRTHERIPEGQQQAHPRQAGGVCNQRSSEGSWVRLRGSSTYSRVINGLVLAFSSTWASSVTRFLFGQSDRI